MRTRHAVLAAVLAAAFAACQAPPPPAGLTEEDRAAITALRDAYAQNTLAGDWAAVAELYAEDAVYAPSQEPAKQGLAAIQEYLEGSAPASAFTISSVTTDGLGDLAFDFGSYSITLAPEGAEPVTNTGHYLVVLRKQADGSWKLTHAVSNSDQPMPAMAAGMPGQGT